MRGNFKGLTGSGIERPYTRNSHHLYGRASRYLEVDSTSDTVRPILPFQDGDGLPSTAVLRDTEALGGDWGFRRSHHMALVFSLQDRTDCRRPPWQDWVAADKLF